MRLKLVTVSGHPVVGLPRHIISGSIAEVEAAWRGAFLARGVLTEPGRSSSLEVLSPCQEAALALVGLASRLSVAAKTKETRGVERVFLRDGDAIAVLLSRMGAQRTRVSWDEKSKKKQMTAKSGQRLATFDDANTRRSAQAAAAAAARVERAMEILGDDVPEHLAEAGHLRVEYRHSSLEELGRLADPPMTKDAVAGRIHAAALACGQARRRARNRRYAIGACGGGRRVRALVLHRRPGRKPGKIGTMRARSNRATLGLNGAARNSTQETSSSGK